MAPDMPARPANAVRAPGAVQLRLYIVPPMPTSMRAITNLRNALDDLGNSVSEIEVETIDITADPLRALKDRVIVTPTLMACCRSEWPTIIGDLSDRVLLRNFILDAARAASGEVSGS